MDRPMTGAVRHVVDVTADLLQGNDQAYAGRLPLFVHCAKCGDRVPRGVGWLGPGRWAIDHLHGGYWSAHLLRLDEETPRPASPVVPRAGYSAAKEARAFVDALALAR